MAAVIVRWPVSPVVTVTNGFQWQNVVWSETRQAGFQFGDTIEIDVKLQWDDAYGGRAEFRVWVEKFDPANSTWAAVHNDAGQDIFINADNHARGSTIKTYRVDVDDQLVRFRVKVSSTELRAQVWTDENYELNSREFYAFVDYFGDFSLDYLPVTILYCPPGQDMYAGFTQNKEYGTALSFGLAEAVGTRTGDSSSVRGGIKANFGYVSGGAQMGVGDESIESQRLETAMTNKITFGYEWNTTLIADNQRVIGRSYWGPLGDIFVLLKNPFFSVIADEQQELMITGSDKTRTATEIIIIPAHRLLRPGDDPVAKLIPEGSRRRLLQLDPFIVNLHKFFAETPGVQPDPTVPLSEAADPYRDPSAGNVDFAGLLDPPRALAMYLGNNRAELVGRYSISNGIELDLSQIARIQLQEQHTNSTQYYAERTDTDSGTSELGIFFDAFTVGESHSHSTGEFTEVNFHASREFVLGEVRTALCKLIRNQVQADLDDVEIWWDKQFSTFMFRRLVPGTSSVSGRVLGPQARPVPIVNMAMTLIPVEAFEEARQRHPFIFEDALRELGRDPTNPIEDVPRLLEALAKVDPFFDRLVGYLPSSRVHRTMTDQLGHYAFRNLRAGRYILFCGDQVKAVELELRQGGGQVDAFVDVHDVKRVLDIRRSSLWELRELARISHDKARRLQTSLLQMRDTDYDTLAKLLASEDSNLEELEKVAVLRLDEEIPRRQRPAIGGFVLTGDAESAANVDVLLARVIAEDKRKKDETSKEKDQEGIATRTDGRGRYRFRNLRAGRYNVSCGGITRQVEITEAEARIGKFMRADIEGAKPSIDLRKLSYWRLKQLFDIRIDKAARISKTIKTTKKFDPQILEQILAKEDISLDSVSKKFTIVYE